MSFVDFGSHFD